MHRRPALFRLAMLLPTLAGCASRAKPPRPSASIERLGVLPIREWEPSGSTAPFSVRLLSPVKVVKSGPAINPSQLGMAIGNSIRASKAAEREQLAHALAPLEFSAQASLSQAIQDVFMQRALPIVEIADINVLESEIRQNKLNDLPQNVDAIIDIQIHGAGYYPTRLGLVPYLSLGARVLSTKAPAGVIEEFGYEVNHGDAKGDPRFFSSPPELITTSLSAFRDNAQPIRTGLNALYRKVAEQLGTDVRRVVDKQDRVH